MFSEILVKLMEERNVTAYQIAKATGLSNTALSRYKSGKQDPAIDKLIAIADFFDVSTDYLLGRTTKREVNR
nr:MAG TPA: Repressor protein CI [Caudoviricetes sp.]